MWMGISGSDHRTQNRMSIKIVKKEEIVGVDFFAVAFRFVVRGCLSFSF